MMVLIVGKTRMKGGICVGGYLIVHNRSVRLIPQGRTNHPQNDDHQVGQIWDVDFYRPAKIVSPHTEDIIVTGSKLIDFIPNVRVAEIIPPYVGCVNGLYDGMIRFTGNGSGYVSHSNGVPDYSTCFWSSDKPLSRVTDGNGIYFQYEINPFRRVRFKYVGFQEPFDTIEPGTTIRMSLARWCSPSPGVGGKCHVQLSRWF
mgnify:CR=1 FL=1